MERDVSNREGKRYGRLNASVLTFIVCLVISMLLWAIVSLSREYTMIYNYDLRCVDIPKERAPEISPRTLSLTFKAKGFGLFNVRFMKKNRHIDLSITELYDHKHKGAIETAGFTRNELTDYVNKKTTLTGKHLSFTRNELTDYLRENGNLDHSFVGVTSPDVLTVSFR